MKAFSQKIALVLSTLALTTTLPAQVRTAVFGRTTLQFSQTFVSTAASLGGSIGDLNLTQLTADAVVLPLNVGIFNPATGVGELEQSSGFTLIGGGKAIQLRDLSIDTTGAVPSISAIFVFNNTVLGRIPLFNIQYPSGITLPLPVTLGVLQVNSLKLTLSSAAASTLNSIFGLNVIPAGLDAGTASVYAVFAPLPDGTL